MSAALPGSRRRAAARDARRDSAVPYDAAYDATRDVVATVSSGPAPASARREADRFRRLVAVTLVLTLALLMLGAWVRLTDAGLGCPDWPGCYGKLTPAQARAQIAEAVAGQGGEHGPVSMGKAWREMGHRYVAMLLGLLVIAIAALAWRWRERLGQSPWLATVLVGVVVLQGLFGKWTVTLLLKPAIVTGHLLGGLLTFVLLLWLWLRQQPRARYVDPEPAAALALPLRLAILAVVAQIFLGGWTSTNYAALACTDLPTCQGSWWPQVNFADGFHFLRELGRTGDGELLPAEALTAIHLSHRIGALVVLALAGWAGWRAWRAPGEERLGAAVLGALGVQWLLGLSNVWFSLPLPVAVAHNGGAAVLLALLVVLHFRAVRAGRMV
ncbi:MAG TPA: COX15/CtaA family protein [Quisquiliibacterium sp.]|nr:COX15/CtaA family protein [Quisquiliibacterium sp.]